MCATRTGVLGKKVVNVVQVVHSLARLSKSLHNLPFLGCAGVVQGLCSWIPPPISISVNHSLFFRPSFRFQYSS